MTYKSFNRLFVSFLLLKPKTPLITPFYSSIRKFCLNPSINSSPLPYFSSSNNNFRSFSTNSTNINDLSSTTSSTTITSTYNRPCGAHLVACYPEQYDQLFLDKQNKLKNLMNWNSSIDCYSSPKENYRMRANFHMWHIDNNNKIPENFIYSMFDYINNNNENDNELLLNENNKKIYNNNNNNSKKIPHEIKNFPRGSIKLNELMIKLKNYLTNSYYNSLSNNKISLLYNNLFETRFLTTKGPKNEALIVLLYKKQLPENEWKIEALELSKELNVKIIGRARKQMIIVKYNQDNYHNNNEEDDEYIEETLTINNKNYTYYQTEGAFSQPNAYICEKMIEWTLENTKNLKNTDLLELYCGGGTFTAPLSTNFKSILATEISKKSVELAKKCFKKNNIKNIRVESLSSEDFTKYYLPKLKKDSKDIINNNNDKHFIDNNDIESNNMQNIINKLKNNNNNKKSIDLSLYNFQTVFVDPPRAGLDLMTIELVREFNRIIYISCNPETLARDKKLLETTHDLVRLAAFDQFPYTDHLEAGAIFIKKK